MLILDPQGRLADLNDAAQAILGRRRHEVAGTPIAGVLPGWSLARLAEGAGELTLDGPTGPRVFEPRVTTFQRAGDQPGRRDGAAP